MPRSRTTAPPPPIVYAAPPEPAPEWVRVEVIVNHELLRRGQVGDIELTDRNRRLIDRGYMRVIGPASADWPASILGEPALG